MFIIGSALVAPLSPDLAYAQTIELSEVTVVPHSSSTKELIDYYTNMYGISSYQMTETIRCESGFKRKAWNKTDPHGGAKGIGQFLQPTFDSYSKKAGISDGDVWDIKDSLQTMAYMFSIGQAKQWTEWRRLFSGTSQSIALCKDRI